ncbi:septum formation initiator [Corynebacterium pseudodiphtheriticum]|uniref:septum formation initiator n=1 Tax=Corynebacterium pseudodiphtheriticum TaxID=37637 RepID=UPI000F888C26|nr:septum formation initiator [Corynebacterium pseudodiphtheriticum]RUP89703.1 septum formation initiator [Corynebacterium pseudodiphtheriticum]RUP95556.1 septum formation initiator [Corynebacterium pseudodiphtheriticum]RUP99275.1 septum formation initiator [Corynebacterium pseudodiphtheriticum]RUQ47686.1 septum formation initiator [Corynebacterium pseudodiphtheriticum]
MSEKHTPASAQTETAGGQGTAGDPGTTTDPGHDQDVRGEKPNNAKWALALFGTAVGAGILFLPINAGSFGFWPLLVATLMIGPMAFLSHRAYARMLSGSSQQGQDVLEVVTGFFGKNIGILIALIYWFTVFPIVMIYGISITNTVDSFIQNQLNGPEISRPILATLCVGLMTLGFALGRNAALLVAQFVIYPLIVALAAVSLYLIPQWDFSSFYHYSADGFVANLGDIILIMPVLVFSFSFLAAISQFVLDTERFYGDDAEKQSSKIVLIATALLTVFTMFFVWSSALALGADGMEEAYEQNIPVLSYLANETGTQFLAFIAPIVVICAIVSSYFGHLLATVEGTRYFGKLVAPRLMRDTKPRTVAIAIYLFVFIVVTAVAIINPSILDMITLIGGIFMGFMTYLLPVWAIYRIDALKRFRPVVSNWFVVIIGVVVMVGTFWDVLRNLVG